MLVRQKLIAAVLYHVLGCCSGGLLLQHSQTCCRGIAHGATWLKLQVVHNLLVWLMGAPAGWHANSVDTLSRKMAIDQLAKGTIIGYNTDAILVTLQHKLYCPGQKLVYCRTSCIDQMKIFLAACKHMRKRVAKHLWSCMCFCRTEASQ